MSEEKEPVVILFDTETTGADDGAQIIEAAFGWPVADAPAAVPVECGLARIVVERFKPSVPIELGAMAVHHIIPSDLEDRPPSSSFALPDGVNVIVGHNIDFDWKMAGSPKVRRICTLALARSVWPNLDAHTQGALIYFLYGPEAGRLLLTTSHRAEIDVQNLSLVLSAICARLKPASWKALWEMSEEARVPTIITFGKHKALPGQPPTKIVDLPRSYREWMLAQADMDPYMKIAIRRSFGMEERP